MDAVASTGDQDEQNALTAFRDQFQPDLEDAAADLKASIGPSLSDLAFKPAEPDGTAPIDPAQIPTPASTAPDPGPDTVFSMPPGITPDVDADPQFLAAVSAIGAAEAQDEAIKTLRIHIRERMVDWVDYGLPPAIDARLHSWMAHLSAPGTDDSFGAADRFFVQKARAKLLDDLGIDVQKDAWNSALFFAEGFARGNYKNEWVDVRTFRASGLDTGERQ